MGYRSDVRCLIYGEPDKLNAFIVKHKLLGTTVFEDFKDELSRGRMQVSIYEQPPPQVDGAKLSIMAGETRRVTHEFLDLNAEGLKWYDTYEDVIAWTALMDDLDDNSVEMGVNYEFVRVGEEHDDLEMRSSEGHNYLGVRVQITEFELNLERIDDAEATESPSADADQPSVLRDPAPQLQDGGGPQPESADGGDGHEGHLLPSSVL